MKIIFIQTGGSIDKDYFANNSNHGYNFDIKDPAFKSVLSRVSPKFKFSTMSVIKKDSLDINDNDRQKIYNACIKAKGDKIIITHGTDTFEKTAKKISTIKNKVIILTGSMKPEKFSNSDADFNIGVAIGAINYLKNGVYIAINGIVSPWEKFNK